MKFATFLLESKHKQSITTEKAIEIAKQTSSESAFMCGYDRACQEYEQKLRFISPNIKPKLMDENSMFSVNVSIRVESVDYEYSGYYNFHTQKWLIYPNEEPFEFQLIAGWRYFL